MTETIGVQQTECQKLSSGGRGEFGDQYIVSKVAERSNKRRTEMLSLSRAERISFTVHNKTVSVLCHLKKGTLKPTTIIHTQKRTVDLPDSSPRHEPKAEMMKSTF